MKKRIRCDIDNRQLPLDVIAAFVGSATGVRLLDVPEDVVGVTLRVCPLGTPASGSPVFYDFAASQTENGEWECEVAKTILTTECDSGWYEVRGVDSSDALVGIGKGKFMTLAFSTGTATDVPTEA